MTHQKTPTGYILCFSIGEDLINGLTQFAKDKQIDGAWLTALGAAQKLKVGYYHLDKKQYEFKQIDELVEITNLTGNLGHKDSEFIAHIHGTFSRSDLSTFGGHVSELTVGGTCEVRLTLTGILNREHNPEVDLNTLKLSNND